MAARCALLLVGAALSLGGCATEPAAPAVSAVESSALAPPAAPVDTTETPAPEPAAALPDDLAGCLPDAVREAVAAVETARARGGAATYAVVEWTDAPEGRAALVDGGGAVVLQLDDGACTPLLTPGTDLTVEDVVPDAVAAPLSEARLDWRIAEAGGADAYAATLRDRYAGRLVECSGPADGWSDCLAPVLAERLRARGVAVDS